MNEVDYVNALTTHLAAKETGRNVLQALIADLPAAVRDRLTGPLAPWTCDGPPAPDMALGDEDDLVRAVFEFKSVSAQTNWPSTSAARGRDFGDDRLSQRIYQEYLDGLDPVFDTAHADDDCAQAPSHFYRMSRSKPGMHYACMHQGDLYRATLPGVTNMRRPAHLGDVVYIFVAPHDKSADTWRYNLVSVDDWHIVQLTAALQRWRDLTKTAPKVKGLVDMTEEFLLVG